MIRRISILCGAALFVVSCAPSTTTPSTVLPSATTPGSSSATSLSTTEVSDDARVFLTEYFTAQLSEAGVSVSSIDCFVDEVIDSGAPEELDALDRADADATAKFLADFFDLHAGRDCLTDQELARMSSASVVPSSFGDNAELDRLWTSCSEGQFSSCDLLWIVSGSPTDYEIFGYTCGERSTEPGDSWCVDLYGSGPEFELLLTECGEGEYGSCDLLTSYLLPEDDDFEFGATCGDRVEATDLQCFFQFGQSFRP